MNSHEEALEFPKIVRMLSGLSFSPTGKEACLALRPVMDLTELEILQQETSDALYLLRMRGAPPLNGLANIESAVKRSRRGAILSMGELRQIGVFLRTVERLQDWAGKQIEESVDVVEVDRLKANTCIARIQGFFGDPKLGLKLERAIISDEEMSDQASPELARIRQSIQAASRRIRTELNEILRRKSDSLQEQLITQRDGRYVVPVKADRRQDVPGILHDSSGSGQTLFVEPLAVVETNNQIRILEGKEHDEIERILWQFSRDVEGIATSLLLDAERATELDVQWAKARLAEDMQAERPQLNEDGKIHLSAARHPLIDKDQVVPIDIYVGEEFQTLVITGPNTGGKTVALKTVGLLTLMAMSGLHIPAAKGSKISTFEQIFADIGDDQSIEQSLSTFSSHMTRMVKICAEVDDRSLVLSDELGSGTDPAEGAALAVAILDYLRQHGAITVATTHYKELKLYALSTEGVENAACEFDVQTLRPTYRILIGVPGTSNAFVISQKLGLDDVILQMAEAQMTEEGLAFERVVSEIEEQRLETERVLEQERQIRNQLARERRKLRQDREALQEERDRVLAAARDEGRGAWSEQITALDALVKELRAELDKGGYAARDAIREAEMLRREAHEARRMMQHREKTAPAKPAVGEYIIGEFYEAKSSGVRGKLVSYDEAANEATLAMGNLQIRVALDDLQSSQAPTTKTSSAGSRKRRRTAVQSMPSELMLIGKRAADAEQMLDSYLDDAVLAGLEQVRIVHGKGSGALRQMCHDFLRQDRRISSFELAGFGEGDAGVTIAQLN